VPTDEFIQAVITRVEYDEAHEFKGEYAKTAPAIRLHFGIEGVSKETNEMYKETKRSRWETYSYDGRSNLYNKYLKPLAGIGPNSKTYNIGELEGMIVKLMFEVGEWKEAKVYNIVMVKSTGKRLEPGEGPDPLDKKVDSNK